MLHAGDGRRGRGPRKGAGPHLGALDRALLSPCPFAIFHVCRAYLGAGFQTPTLFFLEEILKHREMGAEPGGDTESLFRPQGLSLPQDLERLRKAMQPKGWGSPGLPGLRGAAQSRGSSAVVWGLTPAAGGSVRLLPPSESQAPTLGSQLSPKQHGCSALTYPNTTGGGPLAN